ncbi:MAG: bifunctional demethylmenaquinone methyltransferase/2-methoxy-6-polyprenyl-1,4-benzoquinol methylase UbiE [Bacteroidales bacterium]
MADKALKHSGDTVYKIFSRIAVRYDFLNHFLSFGIDKLWRRKLRHLIKQNDPQALLDIATGTGDMLMLLHNAEIKHLHGIDPVKPMLEKARAKFKKRNINDDIHLHPGFAENLPFDTGSFDLANIVFGIRNFDDIDKSLSEIMRILTPGGSISILEFDMPGNRIIRTLYLFYLNKIIPFWGGLISGEKTAYTYLSKSIQAFSENTDVEIRLKQAGFSGTRSISLFFGIARIYTGTKIK